MPILLDEKAKTAAKERFWRELINTVNPRLVLYTRAGLLAATILVLNYAIVGAVATYLMQDCAEITVSQRSDPVSSGDFLTYEGWINRTLAREGTVQSGGVTIKVAVSGCAKRSTATIVAPHPKHSEGLRNPNIAVSTYAALHWYRYRGRGAMLESILAVYKWSLHRLQLW
jgi:hypothetical protein